MEKWKAVVMALLVAAALRSAPAGAATCPDLPAAPEAKVIYLSAANYNTTPFQTLAYNGTKWGPLLKLKLGQLYQIEVTNEDIEVGTSVHWHGQHLLNASWSDGVAPINQMPVPPGSTFVYRFVAEPAGTYWYHSHTTEQYGDGLRGPLIVEDPAGDPQAALYDVDSDDNLILLADVFPITLTQQLINLEEKGMVMGPGGCPYQDISDAPYYAIEVNGESFNTTGAAKVFTVRRGQRYRFRTVCGTSSWGLEVGVANHTTLLIAVDGSPIKPTPAEAFRVTPGERVDFVLTADQPVANYFIYVTTINGLVSPAILHYEGAPDPANDPAVSATAFTPNLTCAAGVGGQPGVVDFKNTSLVAGPEVEAPPLRADRQLTIYLPDPTAQQPPASFAAAAMKPGNAYGLAAGQAAELSANGACPGGVKYCWSLNWNVFQEPESLPIYPESFLPENRTYSIALQQGEVVDVTFVNPSPMVHPMHIHGYSYWVLAAGNGDILMPDGTIDPAKVSYNVRDPILRDNVPVPQAVSAPSSTAADAPAPAGMGGMGRKLLQAVGMGGMGGGAAADGGAAKLPGYTVVRVLADNPGVWSWHCHIDLHAIAGMFMYLTVNEPGGTWYAPENLQCE